MILDVGAPIDMSTLMGMVAQVIVIGGGIVAAYLGIKRWVVKTASTDHVEKQLRTGNGKTIGQLVHDNTEQLQKLDDRVQTVSKQLKKHIGDNHPK